MSDWDSNEYPRSELTHRIIGAAMRVHRALGPGLLESAYQVCLADEMTRQGIHFDKEVELPVVYEGRALDCGYRLDFVVEGSVILELKCVEKLLPIHEAQLLTYLRLSKKPVGLLMNYNVVRFRDGIVRRALTRATPTASSSAPQR